MDHSGGMVVTGEAVHRGRGSMGNLCMSFPQFSFEPKTDLKIVLLKKILYSCFLVFLEERIAVLPIPKYVCIQWMYSNDSRQAS